MKSVTLHIRNMCCQRCVEAVTEELTSLGLDIDSVSLGEATFKFSAKVAGTEIERRLNKRGFILAKSEDEIIVERVKTILLDLIHHLPEDRKKNFNLPAFLEANTNTSYRALLKIFRKQKNITIEKYFILLKIEKAKELIEQSNLSFSEIASMLGYKSQQHLSGQFKEVMGKTMLNYRKSNSRGRIPMDRL
jgi:AraC family transcriptional regulator